MSIQHFTVRLDGITSNLKARVGDKAYALSELKKEGYNIPNAIAVTTDAYSAFLRENGLSERIRFELGRKPFSEMRWEEMWDASLRIQNMFIRSPIPDLIMDAIIETLHTEIGNAPVVVRSSAPGEDSAATSFAGIHESFVNIYGTETILEHIRLVWASLWSDAALLYRQEIGLDPEESSMAVLIQELVVGKSSGVMFTVNPVDNSTSVVEAVHGLNQGLVDGSIEPDRWIVDRCTGDILSHAVAERKSVVLPSVGIGIGVSIIDQAKVFKAPLSSSELREVVRLGSMVEERAGLPQDIEWTLRGNELFLLQARPITTLENKEDAHDKRSWYLSLRKSFENLKKLGDLIENNYLPEMSLVADSLAGIDLKSLSDGELESEVERRNTIHQHWIDVYWEKFIPFAHGIRLFGQIYNRTVKPADPYEFIDLLSDTGMISVRRNERLEEIASTLRDRPSLIRKLKSKRILDSDPELLGNIDAFIEEFSGLNCYNTASPECDTARKSILDTVLALLTIQPSPKAQRGDRASDLILAYIESFPEDSRKEAEAILQLARKSYRLRDDDNIYLARIETQKIAAKNEYQRRQGVISSSEGASVFGDRIRKLNMSDTTPDTNASAIMPPPGFAFFARQLTGQPASPGMVSGIARVIQNEDDLAAFSKGEVLVCDAIDPTMTYIVPLAAGIVERRGGMLIHGAIIAREYGIPCVTGIPSATQLIHTGAKINVDGYLGIVTISKQ